MTHKIKQALCCVVALAAVWPSLGDGRLGGATLPVEVYEKGGGDVDCAAKYSVREKVREAKGAPAGCRLFMRLVKVTNLSNETRIIQVAVRAATAFMPANWVIPA